MAEGDMASDRQLRESDIGHRLGRLPLASHVPGSCRALSGPERRRTGQYSPVDDERRPLLATRRGLRSLVDWRHLLQLLDVLCHERERLETRRHVVHPQRRCFVARSSLAHNDPACRLGRRCVPDGNDLPRVLRKCVASRRSRVRINERRRRELDAGSFPAKLQGAILTCPTANFCIVAGLGSAAPTHAATSIFVTRDGGDQWSRAVLIPGAAYADAITCPSSTGCVVLSANFYTNELELLSTTDGGITWTERRVTGAPAPPDSAVDSVDEPVSLACTSSASCLVAGGPAEGINSGTVFAAPFVLATTDGGSKWRREAAPPGVGAVLGFACGSPISCVAVGSTLVESNNFVDPGRGEAEWTNDGGRRWEGAGSRSRSADWETESRAGRRPRASRRTGNRQAAISRWRRHPEEPLGQVVSCPGTTRYLGPSRARPLVCAFQWASTSCPARVEA